MAHEVSDPVSVPPSAAAEEAHPRQAADTLAALEASLRERELQLEEAHRIANLGTWSWERSTNATTWSDEIYAIFGRTRETYTPRSVTELRNLPNVPASWHRLLDLHQRAIDTGEPYEADIEIEHSDGSRRWIVSRGHAARWEGGQVVALRGTVQDITDRKLSELALEERVRAHREAQRIGRMGSWRWVLATDELTWSEEVYSLMGVDPSQPVIMFSDRPEMFEGDSLQQLQSAIDRAVATGQPYSVDCWLRLSGGTRICLATRGEPIFDPNGDLIEMRGTVRDITDRKTIEEELQQSENRYRSLVHASSDILWTCSATGFQAGELPAWQAFTGQTAAQVHGYGFLDAVHPDDRQNASDTWRQALVTGLKYVHRHRLRRHDGVYRFMECRAAPSRDAHGNIVEWVGMHTDITEQIEAEQAVREREQRFSALAESLPQLVWASDRNGDRIYVNGRYCDYTGVPERDLLGARWREYLHPDDIAHTNDLWLHSMATGEPYLNEYRIRRRDGIYRSFLVRANPVRNEDGEIDRWLGSATDIHDQKLAEEALRRSEKLAATGRLAASIAHEINNPLEAVTNALYLAMLDTSLPQPTRTYLEIAEQELSRVAQVTTQTLRFHRQSVAAIEADLAEVMDSAFGLFASRFEACNVSVHRDYAPGQLLYCRSDEIRQVFANFLSNALDANRSGGRVRIRIRRSGSGTANPGLRVTIADTGHGIPPALHRAIFEPFISTKETTGTGLGLWVSDGIIQKHKGHISLRSRTGEPHHGTVFTLFFPSEGIKTP